MLACINYTSTLLCRLCCVALTSPARLLSFLVAQTLLDFSVSPAAVSSLPLHCLLLSFPLLSSPHSLLLVGMLELGGIRSQRQSRQRPLTATQHTTSTSAADPSSSAHLPASHFVFPVPSAALSRKRPLHFPDHSSDLSTAARPPARIKVERERSDRRDNDSESERESEGGRGLNGNGESGGVVNATRRVGERRCERSAVASVPFVSIRAVKQQTRQRGEETEAEAQEETEAAQSRDRNRHSDSDGAAAVFVGNGRSAAAPQPAVVLMEPLLCPPPPHIAPPPPSSSSLSTAANYKLFHKTPFGRPSSSLSSSPSPVSSSASSHRPPSNKLPTSLQLVVADSGAGCTAASEVESVRHSEHIERLTAQMEESSQYSHSSSSGITGKRKR